MLIILAELYEQEVPSNDQNEDPGHNAPDLHQTESQSGARDRGQRKDWGRNDRTIGNPALVARGSGSLKAALEADSAINNRYKVRP